MSVPSLSTTPESQFSDVEQLSQFNIVAFIENEGIFETQQLEIQLLNEEQHAQLIESQFFLQDDKYEQVEAEEEAEAEADEGDINQVDDGNNEDLETLTPGPEPAGEHT
ncbi:hypothetical protein FQN52_006683 [Onygenales sp. PD_12]|nr:hypothetical protein FQN52_006683 [Onygenales sp. PD_12]